MHESERLIAAEPGNRVDWRGLLRDAVTMCWLFLASGGVIVLLVQGTKPSLSPADEALLRLFVLPSLPLAAAVFVLRWREISETVLRLPSLLLFLAISWGSVAWSLDFGISLRRVISVSAFTFIGAWLAITYTPAALLSRLAWLALSLLLLSVIFAVALPSLAFMPLDGELPLRGVFSHKNGMGHHLGVSAILMATAWQFRLIPRAAAALGLLLCLVLAVPTGSATAILILVALALIRITAAVLTLPGRIAVVIACFFTALLALVGLALIVWSDAVFELLGRDITFTGRVPLWEFVWLQISQRPWLGYGFFVFFEIPWVEAYTVETLGWQIPNAHNGFLELWLGVGALGPLCLLVFLAMGLMRALKAVTVEMSCGAIFAVYFIPIYLLRNLVESDLAAPSQLSWTLAVIAVVTSYRERMAQRA